MAKLKISKDLVVAIANKDNKKFVKSVNDKVGELLTLAVNHLSAQVSYISLDNTVLQPINELFNDAMVDNSEFVYLLGVDNPQLDLNTSKKLSFWQNLKTRAKFAWQNRKLFKKRRKKKRKKQENVEQDLHVDFNPHQYTVYSLAEDLQHALCLNLVETSLVYCHNNRIEIVGKEDFGSNIKIVIFLASLVNGEFKYYTGRKKSGFINLHVDKRLANLKAKRKNAGKNFVKVLKILNTLYYNINGRMPNQIMIESILSFCPDELFEGEDIYGVLLKIVNYIRIKSLRNIYSVINTDKRISEDVLCNDGILGFNKMLNQILSDETIEEETKAEK